MQLNSYDDEITEECPLQFDTITGTALLTDRQKTLEEHHQASLESEAHQTQARAYKALQGLFLCPSTQVGINTITASRQDENLLVQYCHVRMHTMQLKT